LLIKQIAVDSCNNAAAHDGRRRFRSSAEDGAVTQDNNLQQTGWEYLNTPTHLVVGRVPSHQGRHTGL